jgi:hypothetical protein
LLVVGRPLVLLTDDFDEEQLLALLAVAIGEFVIAVEVESLGLVISNLSRRQE